MIKKILVITLMFGFTVACSQQINYDPDYIWGEIKKCNNAPYEAVTQACKVEQEKGLQHKPGCDSVSRVKGKKMDEDIAGYFNPKLKKKNQCPN